MIEFFKVSLSGVQQVDKENFKISGAIIAKKLSGAKDSRRIQIDDQFMADFVAKARTKELPMQADHNYSTRVGTKLAFMKNISATDDSIIGDIQFLKSADKSPINPGMVSFLLDSIEENPKSYMLSMKVDVEYFFAATDKRPVHKRYNWETDEYQWYYTDNKKPYTGFVNMKFRDVSGVDFVGDGALTNSTFSSDTFVDQFNALTTDPEVSKLIKDNFSHLHISKLASSPEHKNKILEFFKNMFNMEQPIVETTPPKIVEASTADTPPAVQPAPTVDLASLSATIVQLAADVKELKEQRTAPPAAEPPAKFAGEHGAGALQSQGEVKVPLYLQGEINKHARAAWLEKQNQAQA